MGASLSLDIVRMTGEVVINGHLWSVSWFQWLLVLCIAFPVVTVLLGELIHRLQRRDSHLDVTARAIRHTVAPALALALFARYVLRIESDTWTRVLDTLVWVCAINAALSLVNVVLFARAEQSTWRARVPRLFLDLTRFLLVVVGATLVLAAVWGRDIGGIMTALGVGTIVIGLALQEPLGSIVSGVALLFERPFAEGDWIRVGDTVGRVIDMNWRSVRLRTADDDIATLPHLMIAKEMILNFTEPARLHVERIAIGFSYDDAPNLVKRTMLEIARATDGVLADPPPQVHTRSYDDFSIAYEVRVYIDDYDRLLDIRDAFTTRIWYAAKRAGLTIPFPIRTLHFFDGQTLRADKDASDLAQGLSATNVLLPSETSDLAATGVGATMLHFGAGEYVVRVGDDGGTLYLVVPGRARMMVGAHGDEQTVLTLGRGEFFGELALHQGESSPVSVVATEDVELVALSAEAVQQIMTTRPALAREVNDISEARTRTIQSVQRLGARG